MTTARSADITRIDPRDAKMMMRIFQIISGANVDPKKVLGGSLRILRGGDHHVIVEVEHFEYDINGDKILLGDGRGFATRTRRFRINLAEEITEDEETQ